MKPTKFFISLLFFALLFTNCTIQKRTVNKGYFVQWHNSNERLPNQNSAFNIGSSLMSPKVDSIKIDNETNLIKKPNWINKVDTCKAFESTYFSNNITAQKRILIHQKPEFPIFSKIIKDKFIYKNKKLDYNPPSQEKIERDPKKVQRVRTFLVLSLISFLLFILDIIFILIVSTTLGDILYFVFMGAFCVFVLLSIVFFVLSFFKTKPKEKTIST